MNGRDYCRNSQQGSLCTASSCSSSSELIAPFGMQPVQGDGQHEQQQRKPQHEHQRQRQSQRQEHEHEHSTHPLL